MQRVVLRAGLLQMRFKVWEPLASHLASTICPVTSLDPYVHIYLYTYIYIHPGVPL